VDSLPIREMTESDLPFIKKGLADIFYASTPEYMKIYLTREMIEQKSFQQFVDNRNNEKTSLKVFVAHSDEELVGFITLGEQLIPEIGITTGIVPDLFVEEKYRNKGVGSRLLDFGIAFFKEKGHAFVSIRTLASNENALHLYQKKGFREEYVRLTKVL
jgi:ribosomal protein S18 acetylase RimI-like enzyme